MIINWIPLWLKSIKEILKYTWQKVKQTKTLNKITIRPSPSKSKRSLTARLSPSLKAPTSILINHPRTLSRNNTIPKTAVSPKLFMGRPYRRMLITLRQGPYQTQDWGSGRYFSLKWDLPQMEIRTRFMSSAENAAANWRTRQVREMREAENVTISIWRD